MQADRDTPATRGAACPETTDNSHRGLSYSCCDPHPRTGLAHSGCSGNACRRKFCYENLRGRQRENLSLEGREQAMTRNSEKDTNQPGHLTLALS